MNVSENAARLAWIAIRFVFCMSVGIALSDIGVRQWACCGIVIGLMVSVKQIEKTEE